MAKKNSKGDIFGKKGSLYEAVAPDGSVLKKLSFSIHTKSALMGAYRSGDSWRASGIVANKVDWGEQIFIPARKVN